MAKRWNLVYFFDGTEGDRHKTEYKDWSNIVRLHDLIPTDPTPDVEQWKFYGDGVGTRVNETLLGSSGGVGLDKRVQESYRHIGSVCRKAQKEGVELFVYVFGFSRGAYAARWFTALVDFCGVPANGVPYAEIEDCFVKRDEVALGRLRRDKKVEKAPRFEMLGLFDTVQTTIFPGKFDARVLPGIVDHCYHAMAYHERRTLFSVERFEPDSKRLEEIWFLGSHTDVGGGYVKRGLSDRTLDWMIGKARTHGLYIDDGPLSDDTAEHVDEPHDSLQWWWMVLDFISGRLWKDRVLLERDRFYRGMKDLYDKLAGFKPHLPPPDQMRYA